MADCDDRQLTEAQRQAGYQNQRTGVQQALRPFSGKPTLANLLDYLNRELVPAVRATRNKLNEVYLPVVDNAPSANPLQYYFSTETANADPTTGFVRLDASPQDTATTIRVSETNARLGDARPWLEVMAGGSTTPLGVVTLADAVNPGRFIRFDLNTMVDQGTYWDLGVSPIESSHDDPFVNGGGLVMSFIPGVASTGTTVPSGSLTPIGANTVIGNDTASTAPPVEIAIAANSILGRAGAAGTGNIESITVPGTGTLTGEVVFVQSSSLRNHVRWSNFTLNALPEMLNNRFIGNVSGATARPAYLGLDLLAQDLFGIGWDSASHNFKLSDIITDHFLANISGATTTPTPIPLSSVDSTSLVYDGTTHTFQRAALTGDVTSAQNSNTVTVNASAITNAKLADMAAGTYKGRVAGGTTGAPQDLTGSQAAGGLRYDGGILLDTTSTGTFAAYSPTGMSVLVTGIRISPAGNVVLQGMVMPASGQAIVLRVGRTSAFTVTINHEDAAATAADRFNTPGNATLVLRAGDSALIRNTEGRNNVVAIGRTSVGDADYGDVTVSAGGTVWTIDNDVVTDAKLRNSAALSVIGRSANSTGDPADIAAANDGEVLRRSGTTLGFGTVATAGITDDAVTNAKLANMAEATIKGRAIAAGTGDPTDLTGTQAASIMRYPPIIDTTSTGTITSYAPTGLDASTTNIRISPTGNTVLRGMVLANGQQLSIRVGRGSAFTVTLNHEDASAAAAAERFNTPGNVALVLRAGEGCLIRNGESRNNVIAAATTSVADADYGDITVTVNGTTWTIDNDVVTDAKLRNSAAVSVIGRSANSTGDPTDIAASANDRLLARTSDSLAFQQLTDGMVPTNTVALTKLANILDNRFLGNISGATGAVTAVDLGSLNSNTIIYESTGKTFIRQALTGDVTALQNSNATTIANGAVTSAKLRNSASLSVIGNPTNASTVPSDIAAANDGEVLRRSGTTLGFGTVATAGIADAAVTNTKLRNSALLSVIGNATNASAVPNDITATNDGEVLRRSGTSLGFGEVTSAGIQNTAVTLAKMADLAQSRIIGRQEGAGTGAPQALTPANVMSIIDGESVTWTGSHTHSGATHSIVTSSTTQITSVGAVTVASNVAVGISSVGSSVDITANTGVTVVAGTEIGLNSPTRAASSFAFGSVGTTAATAADNLVINSVNVVRFTGPVDPLTGMVAVTAGQLVLLVNAHDSTNMGILIENGSSSAANRFAGVGTSRVIRPREMGLAWYDSTSSRWRLLLRDEVDL